MDILVPVVTALVGLATGMVSATWQGGFQLAAGYDAELRTKRVTGYTDLWSMLEPLDLHTPPGPFVGADAQTLSEELRSWYHGQGGMLMSRPTQKQFVRLQKELIAATSPLKEQQLRVLASGLRTRMTADILSRRGSLLGRDRFAK